MKHYIFKNVPAKRTKTMRAIRSKNTGIELKLRRALFERGLRYRLYSRTLPGKPDIVFRRHMIAVFCDSEFWHGRNWRSKKEGIRSNRKYWITKIENNMRRDKDVNVRLRKLGWTVLRFWEHEIDNNLKGVIKRIEDSIKASLD
jgi:DNA mismatch endonuclease (patch repair protein)